MSQELSIEKTIRVRFHECDPLQIVWHGNYLKYFEEARESFGLEHGISYEHVKMNGYATPVVQSSCEHKFPLKYGDECVVKAIFENTRAAKMIFRYEIYLAEKLVCTGKTVQVFTDMDSNLILVNPPFYLEWKEKMGLRDE